MPFWKYDKVDVRDDVKIQLPDNWKLEVYKIVSGDTGKTYYVQVLKEVWEKSSGNDSGSCPIYLCNCPEGTFRASLSVVGLGPACKHAEHLAEFLKERKQQ